MNKLNFIKMQALGNDFIVLDERQGDLSLKSGLVPSICDRRLGVGGDMVIVLKKSAKADVFMQIYNADGSEVEACGNATRCIADIVLKDKGKDLITIETLAGILEASRASVDTITVDMGPAKTNWDEIPIAFERDTLNLRIEIGPFSNPVGVSMGNPHAVFFVKDVEKQRIENYGGALETHPLFPKRANIEFVEVLDRHNVRMRVWERGVGVTLACGSGACATAVAAVRRDLTDRKITVIMDGGPLGVEWRESDGHVFMTGDYHYVFEGRYFYK